MQDRDAKELLERCVRGGRKLVVAREADLPTIKRLQVTCHEAGIPTMLGPCPKGG